MKKPKIISKIKEQAINVESPWLLRLWANFNNLSWNEFSCKNSQNTKYHLRYIIRTLEIVNKRRIKLKLSMKVHLPHTQEPWSMIVPGKKPLLNHPSEIYHLVQNSDALMAQSYQSEAVTDHPSKYVQVLCKYLGQMGSPGLYRTIIL